ncbi:MAG: AgmX/PglI C-terminal domain-containing protein [Polyangiales bacterium]
MVVVVVSAFGALLAAGNAWLRAERRHAQTAHHTEAARGEDQAEAPAPWAQNRGAAGEVPAQARESAEPSPAGEGVLPSVQAGPVVPPRHPGSEVSGSLPPAVIRRVVRRHSNEVRSCYAQGLAQDPQLAGRVTVRFAIGSEGRVIGVTVVEDTLPSPSVGECIARAVRRWEFPQPEGGGVVTVSYPFTFMPG